LVGPFSRFYYRPRLHEFRRAAARSAEFQSSPDQEENRTAARLDYAHFFTLPGNFFPFGHSLATAVVPSRREPMNNVRFAAPFGAPRFGFSLAQSPSLARAHLTLVGGRFSRPSLLIEVCWRGGSSFKSASAAESGKRKRMSEMDDN
jgi:hypothetical protein